jgi:phospho-N-acetylmuramoyl-pentapeptide-transferase
MGKYLIQFLQKKLIGQVIREVGPQSHFSKKGTPTMGGILILLAITISALVFGDWHSIDLWMALIVMIGLGLIGWYDDYTKLVLKNSQGLRSRWKYFWQSVIGLIISIVVYYVFKSQNLLGLFIPGLHVIVPLGLAFILLGYFVIVGSSNAVNLTDGLDGLAIVPTAIVSLGLLILALVESHLNLAQALRLPYVPEAQEMAVFCCAIIGASLGFLWFNAYPAEVFMGDVGALALGGVLGFIALIIKQELILIIMGGIFVLETISVVLQVGSYKLRNKKRIFKMAPIHHHFELSGWPETKVTVRFWIISLILLVLALGLTLL